VNHQDIAAQTIASGSKTFMPDRKNPTAKTTMRMVCQNMNITWSWDIFLYLAAK